MNIIYISGCSRSGTSLLQGLLAQYEGVTALGELRRLGAMLNADSACSCGEVLSQCNYWQNVVANAGLDVSSVKTATTEGAFLRSIKNILLLVSINLNCSVGSDYLVKNSKEYSQVIFDIYQSSSSMNHSSPVLIDSSKLPLHLLHLWVHFPNSIKPVFMVRDGRAVVNSMMRRAGISVYRASWLWRRSVMSLQYVKRAIAPAEEYLKYEDLCMSPNDTVVRVLEKSHGNECKLKSHSVQQHILGGSPSVEDLEINEKVVKEDLRWKKELSKRDLSIFNMIAGRVNKSLGYM